MQLSVISFTRKGIGLSERIEDCPQWGNIRRFTKCKSVATEDREQEEITYVPQSICEWAGEQMEEKNILLFIGACGIAVRAIAPYLTDKLHDSPVLVMDEEGKYVIPILSGHVGGANEIARLLAEHMQAKAVITTATDVNESFAVDLFAKKNALSIENKNGIASISSKILEGKTITVSIEPGHWNQQEKLLSQICIVDYPPKEPVNLVISAEQRDFEAELFLIPKEYVIGIGCKKGKEEQKLITWIQKNLKAMGITMEQIYAVASIDRKKEEKGLLALTRKERIPFLTYSSEELQKVKGDFQESEFVKETVGVSNVCERAALLACGEGGSLVYEKHAEDGMTIAIAKRKWSVSFDEG